MHGNHASHTTFFQFDLLCGANPTIQYGAMQDSTGVLRNMEAQMKSRKMTDYIWKVTENLSKRASSKAGLVVIWTYPLSILYDLFSNPLCGVRNFGSGFTSIPPRGYHIKCVSFRLAVRKHNKYPACVSPRCTKRSLEFHLPVCFISKLLEEQSPEKLGFRFISLFGFRLYP
jgi:hypothetical protein